jgi:hypothetical protein
MNPCWNFQLVAVNIGAERLSYVLNKGSAPISGQPSDCLCHRKRRKVTGDEFRRQWQRRRLDHRTHAHVAKASRADKIAQLRGVVERARRSCHGGGLGTDVSRQGIGEGRNIGRVTDGAPHREGEPAAEAENSPHLPECLDTIGEELHALLTQDYIEGTAFEW